MTGHSPFHYLHGFVWCTTCEHHHIPDIPVVTLGCADCGFGVWPKDLDLAIEHATEYPDHVVYALHHQILLERP